MFFVDRRIGVGEREFGMLKFRTMVADAAALQPQLEEANEAEGALFKIREDPRVTRVGRVLRRLSLDEIPQIVNVLKGEMSLVGPRPLPLRDYSLLEDWHRARYAVLPGMTGLWQISGPLGAHLRRPRPARLHVHRELVDLARHHDHRENDPCRDPAARRVLACAAEDTRGRLRGRPRLPLRLRARVVAALEGDVRVRGRPRVTPYRGRPVESLWWRVAPGPMYIEGETYQVVRNVVARVQGDRPAPRGVEARE